MSSSLFFRGEAFAPNMIEATLPTFSATVPGRPHRSGYFGRAILQDLVEKKRWPLLRDQMVRAALSRTHTSVLDKETIQKVLTLELNRQYMVSLMKIAGYPLAGRFDSFDSLDSLNVIESTPEFTMARATMLPLIKEAASIYFEGRKEFEAPVLGVYNLTHSPRTIAQSLAEFFRSLKRSSAGKAADGAIFRDKLKDVFAFIDKYDSDYAANAKKGRKVLDFGSFTNKELKEFSLLVEDGLRSLIGVDTSDSAQTVLDHAKTFKGSEAVFSSALDEFCPEFFKARPGSTSLAARPLRKSVVSTAFIYQGLGWIGLINRVINQYIDGPALDLSGIADHPLELDEFYSALLIALGEDSSRTDKDGNLLGAIGSHVVVGIDRSIADSKIAKRSTIGVSPGFISENTKMRRSIFNDLIGSFLHGGLAMFCEVIEVHGRFEIDETVFSQLDFSIRKEARKVMTMEKTVLSGPISLSFFDSWVVMFGNSQGSLSAGAHHVTHLTENLIHDIDVLAGQVAEMSSNYLSIEADDILHRAKRHSGTVTNMIVGDGRSQFLAKGLTVKELDSNVIDPTTILIESTERFRTRSKSVKTVRGFEAAVVVKNLLNITEQEFDYTVFDRVSDQIFGDENDLSQSKVFTFSEKSFFKNISRIGNDLGFVEPQFNSFSRNEITWKDLIPNLHVGPHVSSSNLNVARVASRNADLLLSNSGLRSQAEITELLFFGKETQRSIHSINVPSDENSQRNAGVRFIRPSVLKTVMNVMIDQSINHHAYCHFNGFGSRIDSHNKTYLWRMTKFDEMFTQWVPTDLLRNIIMFQARTNKVDQSIADRIYKLERNKVYISNEFKNSAEEIADSFVETLNMQIGPKGIAIAIKHIAGLYTAEETRSVMHPVDTGIAELLVRHIGIGNLGDDLVSKLYFMEIVMNKLRSLSADSVVTSVYLT